MKGDVVQQRDIALMQAGASLEEQRKQIMGSAAQNLLAGAQPMQVVQAVFNAALNLGLQVQTGVNGSPVSTAEDAREEALPTGQYL